MGLSQRTSLVICYPGAGLGHSLVSDYIFSQSASDLQLPPVDSH